MITEWHLIDTGYCTVRKTVAYGTGHGTTSCHAVCTLLHHSTRGWFLFDTGYAPRVVAAARSFPYSLYRLATPLHLSASTTAVRKIADFGLTPDAIQIVIVSHFHADHIGGLHDFDKTRFVASRAAFGAVAHRVGFDAVRRAFLPLLLPTDFMERATWFESLPQRKSLPGLGEPRDLFGDGSCLLVALPGHATGQIGLLAQTIDNAILFFVADAAYSAQAIRENIPFHPVTRLFTNDTTAARTTLQALHDYHRAYPRTQLLPTHCPEVFARCAR